MHWPGYLISIDTCLVEDEGKGGVHTAIGIEEADVPVFVPAQHHAFDATARPRSAMDHILVFRDAAARVQAKRTVQTGRRGCDGVDARGGCAVICLLAGHADHFLAGPGIVDEDGGIGVGDDEGFAVQGEGTDAGG